MSSPKRTASPAPNSSDTKRIRLTVNQGVTPVDPENAAGKRSELEPIQGGDVGNLPPATAAAASAEPASAIPARLLKAEGDGEGGDDSGDVSMAEGADAADEEAESAEENDDDNEEQDCTDSQEDLASTDESEIRTLLRATLVYRRLFPSTSSLPQKKAKKAFLFNAPKTHAERLLRNVKKLRFRLELKLQPF